MRAGALVRLLRAFDRPDDSSCWSWRRAIDPLGYGRFWLDGGMRLAHRTVYQVFFGPIADGSVLDHLCRNPTCVNPRHLEAVTQAENVRRGRSGRLQTSRTHCPRDHEYTDANTRRYRGRRFCRACDNNRVRSPRPKATASAIGAAGSNPHTKENQ